LTFGAFLQNFAAQIIWKAKSWEERAMSRELFVYLNGAIIEAHKACVSPFDRGFLWGDGVYEVTPCFNRKFFRLDEHLGRLYRSLRFVRIDPGVTREQMEKTTRELLEANFDRLEENGLCRVGHWVTRGVDASSWLARDAGPATILIFFSPVSLEPLMRNFREGVKLTVVPTRRVPPQCLETRAKVTSKMNQILAELDAHESGTLALMLDTDGNVAEHPIANFFIVRDGVIWTPPGRNVLEGITRKVIFELALRLGIPHEEKNFTIYDIAQADEFFLTSSGFCAMPVRQVDGFRPKASIPGPITQRLIKAFGEETGFDFRM
jgi:branched-chain amino acid aminotransferase